MEVGGQIEMISMIWLFTQILKKLLFDRLPDVYQDKATLLTCFFASGVIIYINYTAMPYNEMAKAAFTYGLLTQGAHGTLSGASTRFKGGGKKKKRK